MRSLRLLCGALLCTSFMGCTYTASHTEVNSDFFKSPTDLQQKYDRVASSYESRQLTKNQVLDLLGLKGEERDGIQRLGPEEIYTYMCGSTFNSCLPREEFKKLSGFRVAYTDTSETVTVNPSISATVHDLGHDQSVVAVFGENGYLVQPYEQGIAQIQKKKTIYIWALLGNLFKQGVTQGGRAAFKAALP